MQIDRGTGRQAGKQAEIRKANYHTNLEKRQLFQFASDCNVTPTLQMINLCKYSCLIFREMRIIGATFLYEYTKHRLKFHNSTVGLNMHMN